MVFPTFTKRIGPDEIQRVEFEKSGLCSEYYRKRKWDTTGRREDLVIGGFLHDIWEK